MKKLYFNGQSSAIGDQTGNWRSRVASLVAQKSVSKAKDPARPTSNRTQIVANLNVQSIFGWLRTDLGFGGLANPYALDERHFVALAGHIGTKKEMGQIGSARAAGYATYCRHLARWIDKPELVAVFNQALGKDVCKRSLIADRDKSWSAAGLDTEKKITEIMKAERWVGIALACQKTFGMRKREILMFQPFTDIRAVKSIDAKQQDGKQLRKKRDLTACHWKEWVGGITIDIVRGTKGKRPRCLYIEPTNEIALEFAWQVLQEMNAYGDRETLGPSQFTLQQNSGTYERALIKFGITQKDLGVTGHGLRAGFACDMLQTYDITPTVRGGDGRHSDPDVQRRAYKSTTEAMGHGRISVISAYAGGFTPQAAARQKKAQERQALIEAQAQGPSAAEEMASLVTRCKDNRPQLVTQKDAGFVTQRPPEKAVQQMVKESS